ncbi:ABC transporter substrate-binding protein [Halobaculum sp. MBLA0147]|uniref:ABC transporter substrate-binding protein n=1 Tax=Halobaculum sp. MBLA0147 TaxID=3079934 RepID=UPI0035261B0C
MPEDTTRRGFLAAAGTGAAAALAGCSGNEPADSTETQAQTDTGTPEPTDTATPTPDKEQTGGTLQLASPGPVQTLDPVNAKGSGAGYNQYNATLMNFPNGDLPPVGDLATDYELSNGGKTYTFSLKQGVQFHDGTELTAEDFVYSWERLAGSEETRNADDIIGDTMTIQHETTEGMDGVAAFKPGTLAVEAVDEYTLEFTMETPFLGTLQQVAGGAFAPIPAGAVAYPKDYEQHGLDGLMYEGEYEYNEYFSTQGDGPFFAGAGPFTVDSWSKGDQIVLSAFDDYHGEGPLIDEIVFTVIGNSSTRYSRYKNGNLDMLGVSSSTAIPTAQFDPSRRTIDTDRGTYRTGTYEMDNGETTNYGEAPALDTDYIVFNCARTPKPVRQAIAYLINQERIANDVYKGLNVPAYHLSPPAAFPAAEGENPADNYNAHYQDGEGSQLDVASDGYMYGIGEARIDQAKQVMRDAGYGPDNRYEVEFTVFSGSTGWDAISKNLRDKASAAFIDINIVKADFGTIIGQALDGAMDMFSLGDGMEYADPSNFLRFIPPYDEPSGMFTRWTYQVRASDVDTAGAGVEQIRDDVYGALDADFPKDHIKVENTGDDAENPPAVRVAIENVTPDELSSALSSAGYTVNGSVESTQAEFDPLMPRSDRQWDKYQANRGPSAEERAARREVYRFVEETNWEAVQELPLVHGISQRIWQDRVNVRMSGTMEDQTFNQLTLDDGN